MGPTVGPARQQAQVGERGWVRAGRASWAAAQAAERERGGGVGALGRGEAGPREWKGEAFLFYLFQNRFSYFLFLLPKLNKHKQIK